MKENHHASHAMEENAIGGSTVLKNAPIGPYVPVSNVARARKFHEEKIGLKQISNAIPVHLERKCP